MSWYTSNVSYQKKTYIVTWVHVGCGKDTAHVIRFNT